MAKKKGRKGKKRKQSGEKSLNLILIGLIIVLCAILFFRSEKGKLILEDLKNAEFAKEILVTDTPKEDVSENGDGQIVISTNTDNTLRVDFIDVGQGDSALITTPGGEYVLVDAGPVDSANKLLAYLESADVDEIEYFILSHPHADHVGGAAEVFYEYKVNNVIIPDVATSSASFTRLLDAISKEKEEGCSVYRSNPGDEYNVDNCNMEILAPVEIDSDDLNNCSIVMTFEYKDFSVIFTGDAEAKSEKLILSGGADIDCDILKVGHHGSSSSTTPKFLDAVSPTAAVISCEKNNSYGHPHTETIKVLKERSIPYYVTADCGTVSVVSDGKEYSVVTEKN